MTKQHSNDFENGEELSNKIFQLVADSGVGPSNRIRAIGTVLAIYAGVTYPPEHREHFISEVVANLRKSFLRVDEMIGKENE